MLHFWVLLRSGKPAPLVEHFSSRASLPVELVIINREKCRASVFLGHVVFKAEKRGTRFRFNDFAALRCRAGAVEKNVVSFHQPRNRDFWCWANVLLHFSRFFFGGCETRHVVEFFGTLVNRLLFNLLFRVILLC